MEIKRYIIRLVKVVGWSYLNILGFTLVAGGINEGIPWLVLVGILMVDLSPSFIKLIWRDAWGNGTYNKPEAN